MRRPRRLATTALVVVLTATACWGAGDDASPDAGQRVTLTLLTHDSFDVSATVLEAFENEHELEVRLLPAGDTGTLVNRAILTAGRPEGDVLFGLDSNLLVTALDADLFVPYVSPRLDVVDDAFELDPEHRVTPIDHGEVCVNADRTFFEEADPPAPQTLEELADPAYRDLLVVENPATSTPGLAFLLATVAAFGDPGWEGYWIDLRDNGALVVDGWETAYYSEFSGAAGSDGDRPLVVSYATSPVAEVVFAEDPPAHAPTGVMEASCFRQVEFAGILRGTEHEAEARELVDFLLSRPFQQDIPLKMFVYPVAGDAELPAAFREHAVVIEDPLELPADEIARMRAEWVERWTDLVLR